MMDTVMQLTERIKSAAVGMQAALRGRPTRRQVCQRHLAATRIQRLCRRVMERVRFNKAVQAAALSKYMRRQRSATIIQKIVRRFQVHTALQSQRRAALICQATIRKFLACPEDERRIRRASWAMAKSAAILIQAAFRGRLTRRRVCQRHLAATSLQRLWRGVLARLSFTKAVEAATAIQKVWRGRIAVSKYIAVLERRRRAATIVQKNVRRFLCTALQSQRRAAVICQSAIRMLLAWPESERRIRRASWAMARAAKRTRLRRQHASKVLQCAFRCHLARRRVRSFRARQAQAAHMLLKRNTARCKVIMASWRAFAVSRAAFRVRNIESLLRGEERFRHFMKQRAEERARRLLPEPAAPVVPSTPSEDAGPSPTLSDAPTR